MYLQGLPLKKPCVTSAFCVQTRRGTEHSWQKGVRPTPRGNEGRSRRSECLAEQTTSMACLFSAARQIRTGASEDSWTCSDKFLNAAVLHFADGLVTRVACLSCFFERHR